NPFRFVPILLRDPELGIDTRRRTHVLTAEHDHHVDGLDATTDLLPPVASHRLPYRPINDLEGRVRLLGLPHQQIPQSFIVLQIEGYERPFRIHAAGSSPPLEDLLYRCYMTGTIGETQRPRKSSNFRGLPWLRGLDLNQRPLGYEPFSNRDWSRRATNNR